MELVEQQPDLDAVIVAVGGGGYISGIGTVLQQLSPKTQLIACWPENATSMYSALEAGHIFPVEEQETLSDGTAGGVEPNAITFPLCQQLIDRKFWSVKRKSNGRCARLPPAIAGLLKARPG
ncbi:Phenylserine dehydratase [Serratia plymuthica]|uniref:Phenylserine dehydratase n=1 Tax=Serratia plymuthica TaxID=82996 RepID=A0A2X4TPA6_SERPL|nr:Phenylserine dehydratase [Serratia plymuthica]